MIHTKFNITNKAILCLVPLSLTITGCFGYRDVVDPYYPKRYNVDARNSVRASLAPQVSNGNVLDQTVWDFHFETGKPELNAMGKDHLKRLARRRPVAQEVIFLQVAQNPDENANNKELNKARSENIKTHMTKISQDKVHPEFQVVLHDPAEVSGSGIEATRIIGGKQSGVSGIFTPGQSGSSAGGNSGQSANGNGNTQVNISGGY
ncbi:MAG: hypothetical protein WCL90_15940 [Planctomycetota bacterium]